MTVHPYQIGAEYRQNILKDVLGAGVANDR